MSTPKALPPAISSLKILSQKITNRKEQKQLSQVFPDDMNIEKLAVNFCFVLKINANKYLNKIKSLIGNQLPLSSFFDFRYRYMYAVSLANNGHTQRALNICTKLLEEMDKGMMITSLYTEIAKFMLDLWEKETLKNK